MKASVITPNRHKYYVDLLSEISGRIMLKTITVDNVTSIHPVLLIGEPKFDAYIEIKKLPVVELPCRFKLTRPKRLLFDLINRVNYQYDYDSFLRIYASFGMMPLMMKIRGRVGRN